MSNEQIEDDDWTSLVSRGDLKREIAIDSYVDHEIRELWGLNLPSDITESRQRLEEFVRRVRFHAQPGDEWWEWVQGSEPQMQTGGLAVVRNGTIVWATMTWIS